MFDKNELLVGSILQASVDTRINNGMKVAPAMVTRVKSSDDEGDRVNLRVFLDTGADTRYNNVPIVDGPPPNQSDLNPEKVAWWPQS